MPEAALKLLPGVNVEKTFTLNESAISACNLIRFRAGLPEKLGGWQRFYSLSVLGVPRDLHAWQDLNDVDRLAVGTTTNLFSITAAGVLTDISPQGFSTNNTPDFSTTITSPTVTIVDAGVTNPTIFDTVFIETPVSVGGLILFGVYPIASIVATHSYTITAASNATATVANGGAVPVFGTTSGSSSVSVTLVGHGLAAGDKVTFAVSTTVGGVTISGTYSVSSITSADIFVIIASTQATATTSGAMNAAKARLTYYFAQGPAAIGAGYGVGGYGDGGYGTGVVPGSQVGPALGTTDWSSDNWGEILLACQKNGGIYYWNPNGSLINAALVSSGPIYNGGIFVSMPQQILVAWASTITNDIGVDQDPLLVRWSDIENFFEWTVTSATQAGSFHIPTGSKIMGGLQGPTQGLIWTDIDLYATRYLGAPLVFGFNKIGAGCGLIGQHAAANLRDNVYWMSQGNFFTLSGGRVAPIPCSVWDKVFQNLSATYSYKAVAAPNSAANEIWFHYPSANATENDSFVKFNIDEGVWDYGTLPVAGRSAWIDQSVLGKPIGATPTGLIYQHEMGYNADGAAISWFFETGWFVITEGQNLAFVDWFFPDMKWGTSAGSQNATVLVTITAADYPNETERTYGPYSTTAALSYVTPRLRGRQIKLRFEGSDLGTFSRLGLMRYRVAMDGRR